jgi:outer membrane protein TolC
MLRDGCTKGVFPVCQWRILTRAACALLLALACGCTTTYRLRRLEKRVRTHLDSVQCQATPDLPVERFDLAAYRPATVDAEAEVPVLDLRQSLALAARYSREYQTLREALYSSAITLWVENHRWEWNPTNNIEGVLRRDLDVPQTTLTGNAQAAASHQLISGGRLATSLAINCLKFMTGDHGVDIYTTAGITLQQPLLAGAGALVAREGLTQAERNLVYALRGYVRQRKQLLLRVADGYYNVVSAQDAFENAQRKYDSVKSARERAEFMSKAGRQQEFQTDQARQNELAARASVLGRQQSLDASRDALKQLLGLPLSAALDVDRQDLGRLAAAELPRPPLGLDAAIEQALSARLDYATAQQEAEDAERAVRIAANGMLPRLDFTAAATAASPVADRVRGMEWDRGSYSAGVQAELPLDKTRETAAYRRAQIALDRSRRALDEKRDQITSEIRADWRNLQTAEENYRIQQMSRDLARRRVESTELLQQAGRVNMRDVLDARDDLTLAENAVTQALVAHRLNWLRLLFDLERLPTEPDTLWSPALELTAVAAAKEANP